MASSSNRRSGSSGRSGPRKRVVIGAEETVRVHYKKNQPQVEAERRSTPRQNAKVASNRAGIGGPAPSRHGKRISAAKRDEREKRQKVVRAKRIGAALAAVALVVAAVWGVIALGDAPIFDLKSVTVSGASRLSQEQVLEIARVPMGTSLFKVRTDEIAKRLESQPWIASVELDRDFPSTLHVAVEERQPAAVADAGGTELWVVATDGVWLGKRSEDESDTLVVRDVSGLKPVAGRKSASKELANAILIARGISPELKAMTRAISAPSVDKTAILTTKDVEIFIGSAVDIADKDRIAREILRREKGKVVYINVRVVERPTWRGLE